MLKVLTFLALAFYVLPVQAYAQPDKTHKTANGDNPSTPVAPIAPKRDGSPNLQPKPNAHVDSDVRVISTPPKDRYDKAAFWANIVLTFVGLGGIVVASITLCRIHRQAVEMRLQRILMQRTLNAIRQQGALMEGQLRLQEVQYKQWVEIGLWKNATPHIQPTATEAMLTLGYEVGNGTNFPLTLKQITAIKGAESSSFSLEHLIAPKDSYAAFYSFDVAHSQLELYRLNKLEVTLSIEVTIRDVMEKDCAPQRFTQTITFGPTRCDVVEHPRHVQLKIIQLK